jgi:membrane associated rhomboid family serine protease
VLLPGAWIVTLVPWIVPVVPLPAFVFLLVWFAFKAMSGVGVFLRGEVAGGGVAWWAHAGGFIAGVVLTVFARRRKWISARRSK